MLLFTDFLVTTWTKCWSLYDSTFLAVGGAQFTYSSILVSLLAIAIVIAIFWRGGSK